MFTKPEANIDYRFSNKSQKRVIGGSRKSVLDVKKQMASTTSKLLDLIAEEEEVHEETIPDDIGGRN